MRVLVLSPYPEKIAEPIRLTHDEIQSTAEPITDSDADLIVAYGYRHILKGPILDKFRGRIFNLHVSYLPWNRGADPNFWSWFDNTPKGVTIHLMTQRIDRGPIIAKRRVPLIGHETLQESYDFLQLRIEALFFREWLCIRTGRFDPDNFQCTWDQIKTHKSAEKEKLMHRFPKGNDTRCSDVAEFGKMHRVMADMDRAKND